MNEMGMKHTGKIIKQLRESMGESQEQLAAAVNAPNRETVARWEIGARDLKREHIIALAQHFNVSSDYLLGLSDVMSPEQNIINICTFTGLSEKAVNSIAFSKENSGENNNANLGLNHFVESVDFIEFSFQLMQIYNMFRVSQEYASSKLLLEEYKVSKTSEEFESEIEKSEYLLQLIGLHTIDKANYYNLCIRNAEDCLRRAFEDWKKQIFNNL